MSCPSFSIRVQTGQLMIVLFRGEQHKDQVQDDPHVKLALEMIEKVAVILEDRDDSASFMVSEAFLVTKSHFRRKHALLCGTHLPDTFPDPAPSGFGANEDPDFALDSGRYLNRT